MFYKLISRSNKRNRKENGLFFSTLLISIVAFYIILALPRQDVMLFLKKMESDAVDKLMTIIPVFYAMTLFILFFLIYYASKFQLERRRHEFGVCLMMGMRRTRLFFMLLAEDLGNSILSLAIGLPVAVLLSELVSLVTAKLVGIGIIGHQVSFSPQAVLWTAAGFLLVKCTAFLLLSGRISRQEIGSLLAETPEGVKRQLPTPCYAFASLAGILCLCAAYTMAIGGMAWSNIQEMGLTLILGLSGTFSLFWGLRFLIGLAVRLGKHDRKLHVFNFRQIQETVIRRSGTLAICSLLILASLCCFGTGVAISRFYGSSGHHVLDYTFDCDENAMDADVILDVLKSYGLDTSFADLFGIRVGHIRTTDDVNAAFQMVPVMDFLEELPPSTDRDILLNNLQYTTYPYLISLSGYNRLLAAAGLSELELGVGEASVYMDSEFTAGGRIRILDNILSARPEVLLDGDSLRLTGEIQTTDLVTDRSITLSFALILPDEVFEHYTKGDYSTYLNGILDKSMIGQTSLMSAISEMNGELDQTGLSYESYLQNMGRQLFYMVAASYITIYLAVIFLIIANTVIGLQFLIGQQKSGRRYRTLIRLGAAYGTLCRSAKKQINWYFGIPIAAAAASSLFGVRALFSGILSSRAKGNLHEMMFVSAAMIFALCVIEYAYMAAVKRSSDRYLLSLMIPEREE